MNLWEKVTGLSNYSAFEKERDTFYQQMADVGALLTEQGVPVVFDATANRRVYLDRARQQVPHFVEIYVECSTVPGLQTEYEPPETPDLVLHCEGESPEAAARRVVALLIEKDYIR
jgi:adenylylsulfate kinase-like enzyme